MTARSRLALFASLALTACSSGSPGRRGAAAASGGDAGDAGQTATERAAAAAEPGSVEVRVVWPEPAAELLRSPGRNACGNRRRAPIPVAPAAVIADRYATARMVAVSGAAVTLVGAELERPDDPPAAELALRGCAFSPAMVRVAGPGARLAVINDDERRHAVRLEHLGGRDRAEVIAEIPLPLVGQRVEIAIDRPGIVRAVSAADPEDVGYAAVAGENPVAITDASGRARFPAVPPGRYRVEVWYPPTTGGAAHTGDATAEVASDDTARVRVELAP